MTLELFLGLFGSITGSFGLWISWRQWRSDRHVLKLSGHFSASESVTNPGLHFVAHLTLKNHGRRLIKIIKVGIIMDQNKWTEVDGNRVFMTDSRLVPPGLNPQKLNLEEGDRHDFEVDPFDLAYLAPAGERGDKTITFYAIDSLDREHRFKVKIPDDEFIKSLEVARKPKTNTGDE